MSANQGAIVSLLAQKEIGYSIVTNDSGWCVELDDPIMGKDLEDLIKATDTQAHVVAAATPNVGLVVQTEGFEYEDELPASSVQSDGDDSAP